MHFKLAPTEETFRALGATAEQIKQLHERNEAEHNKAVLQKNDLQKQILPNGRILLKELECIVEGIGNKRMVDLVLDFCIENGGSNIGFENELLFIVVEGVKIELGVVSTDMPKQFSEIILNHYDFVAKESRNPQYGDSFKFSRTDGVMRQFRLFSPSMDGYYHGIGAYLFDVRQGQNCSKQIFARLLFEIAK